MDSPDKGVDMRLLAILWLLVFAGLLRADYEKAYANAVRDSLPCIVFVGCPAEPVDGAWCCSVESLADFPKGSVVISTPSGDTLYFSRILKHGDKITLARDADSLPEVNRLRAGRGLAPYAHDEGLYQAALAAAKYRAANLIAEHTSNDFSFLPPGASSNVAGCGALEPSWGWGACATFDNYTYCGAASVPGRDGKIYHHAFYR